MCLPHVTQHVVEGLQRRTFLGFVGGAAMANLVPAGESMAAPRAPELDLDLEFAAQMAGSAIAYTLTLHNPHAQEISRILADRPHSSGHCLPSPPRRPTAPPGTHRQRRVSWELPRIAPASSLGPFRYEMHGHRRGAPDPQPCPGPWRGPLAP